MQVILNGNRVEVVANSRSIATVSVSESNASSHVAIVMTRAELLVAATAMLSAAINMQQE
jgi:hypothetical protein